MFNWSLLKVFVAIYIAMFIPPILVIGVRNAIINRFGHKALEAQDDLYKRRDELDMQAREKSEKERKPEDTPRDIWDRRDKILDELKEKDVTYQYLLDKYRKYDKITDWLNDHFTADEVTWKNAFHVCVGWVSCVLCCIGIGIFTLFFALEIPNNIHDYNHWEETVARYEGIEHPTSKDCRVAEEVNKTYLEMAFITKEAKNAKPLINTEGMWAKLQHNVNVEGAKLFNSGLEAN